MAYIVFLVRMITFIKGGCSYDTAREIFFEFVFLVCMCPWTVTGKVNLKLNIIIFILINLAMNLMHSILNVEIVYSNPNTGGIMTALAVLLSLIFIKKDNWRRWVCLSIYWVYSVYEMIGFEARSAEVSIVVSVTAILFMTLCRKLNPKVIVCACFVLSLILTAGIYGYINYNLKDMDKNFTETEAQINLISSGRYKIWQDAVVSHENTMLWGVGSPKEEKQIRNDYLRKNFISSGGNSEEYVPTTFSLHNGYLSTIFVNGWVGYILMTLILIHKIYLSESFKGYDRYIWRNRPIILAAVVIYCLMICHFEAMLLSCRYFTWLIIVIILSADAEKDKNETNNADSKL